MIEYLFLAILVLVMYAVSTWASGREDFESGESVTLEDPEKIYDSEYANIYNALWHSSKELTDFVNVSFQDIMLADKQTTAVNVLDLCCGTAIHACFFKTLGVEYTGVDISGDMLAKARTSCPGSKFQRGDVTNASLFAPKSFSHAILMGFSIYQFPNAKVVSDNAYQWIEPGGTFVVHLVEPDKYDPLLNLASPFTAFSLQKYSLDRQTKSEIYFDNFKYSGELKKKKNEDDAKYEEVLTYFNPATSPMHVKYREHIHNWTMPSVERMIEIIKTSGFRLKEKVDLVSSGKEYQYLVYFTK
jgi:ubiquinone/menaquinone biosynthesis C-methylase UbiE